MRSTVRENSNACFFFKGVFFYKGLTIFSKAFFFQRANYFFKGVFFKGLTIFSKGQLFFKGDFDSKTDSHVSWSLGNVKGRGILYFEKKNRNLKSWLFGSKFSFEVGKKKSLPKPKISKISRKFHFEKKYLSDNCFSFNQILANAVSHV